MEYLLFEEDKKRERNNVKTKLGWFGTGFYTRAWSSCAAGGENPFPQSTAPLARLVLLLPKLSGGEHLRQHDMGMGQNLPSRGPQVVVIVSFYQGSILGTYF